MNGLIALILALTAGLNFLLVVSAIPFVKEEYKNPPLLIWLSSVWLFVIACSYLAALFFFAPDYFKSPSLLSTLGVFSLVVSYSGAICFFSYLSKNVGWKEIGKVIFVILVINIALIVFSLWLSPELRVMAPSIWGIILSGWLLYKLTSSDYPQGEYLVYTLKILALATLLPAILWIGLVLNFYNEVIPFLTKEQLLQWGDAIRIIRNLSAPISFFIMFIYWIKYDSSFARKAKEDKAKVLELLREKDSLINELSKVNSLASAGALAGGLAHELNQYLAMIQINADEALNHSANNPAYEIFRIPLKRILDANRDAAGMIGSLRATFSVREDTHIRMEIAEAIKDVSNLYRGRMVKSKIELKLSIPNQVGVISWGAQLSIVLSNLILNAIEALDASHNLNKLIVISYESTEKFILIKIFDNGSAIQSDKVDSIFTLLSTTKKEGIGVGLWLSKFIMEKNNSDLFFENANDGGVDFILKIPKSLLSQQ
jgi:signal transduction histidine kinase